MAEEEEPVLAEKGRWYGQDMRKEKATCNSPKKDRSLDAMIKDNALEWLNANARGALQFGA